MIRFLVTEMKINPQTHVYKSSVTCLHYACGKGSLKVVQFLVKECNCSVNAPGPYGMTPLYIAVKYNRLNVAKVLLTLTQDTTIKDRHKWTMQHWAAYHGNVEMLKLLGSESLWRQRNARGEDVAMIAARARQRSVLKYLQERQEPSFFRCLNPDVLKSAEADWDLVHWLIDTSGPLLNPMHTLMELGAPIELICKHAGSEPVDLSLILKFDRADILERFMQVTALKYELLFRSVTLPPRVWKVVSKQYVWELRRSWLYVLEALQVASIGAEEMALARLPRSLAREVTYYF